MVSLASGQTATFNLNSCQEQRGQAQGLAVAPQTFDLTSGQTASLTSAPTQVLAVVLQQLVDQTPLPILLMRTVILCLRLR